MLELCPLCCSSNTVHYTHDKRRSYLQCKDCELVFVPRNELLSLEQEKAIYDTHQNAIDDEGYQRFLNRAAKPLLEELTSPSEGLDFGCGPGPALAYMISQHQHNVTLYDIFYYPETSVLNTQYDFVTCTEVIEHVSKPQQVWQQLYDLVKPGGLLVIMTKLVIDKERFTHWHYKNDMTHINFFSQMTFNKLAEQFDMSLKYVAQDVMLFKKPPMV